MYVVDSSRSVWSYTCLSYSRLSYLLCFLSSLPIHKLYHPFTPYAPRWCDLCNVANSTTSTTSFSLLGLLFSHPLPLLYTSSNVQKKSLGYWWYHSHPCPAQDGVVQTKQKNKNVKMLPFLCSSLPSTPQRGISQYATVKTPCFQVCC